MTYSVNNFFYYYTAVILIFQHFYLRNVEQKMHPLKTEVLFVSFAECSMLLYKRLLIQ